VAGYQQTQSRLEDVSAKKSEVDEGKERMLGEISRVVQDINQQIKARPLFRSMSLSLALSDAAGQERKSRLAPLIKDLRTLRERYQEIESDYLQKKGVYDSTAAGLDTCVFTSLSLSLAGSLSVWRR
jgi:intraflagellar transport protein 81